MNQNIPQQKKVNLKFNKVDQPDFFRVLNKRVSQYFRENNLSRKANLNMVIKTIFMLSLYFIPFILMLTGTVASAGGVLLLWAIMGFGMAGIGLSVMHDANHGTYSSHKFINRSLGFVINFMGTFHGTWRIQHNVLHHSYTNIEGFDEDTDNEILRFSPNRTPKSIFRYQAYYAPFLYCLMSLNRFLVKDFVQIWSFKKRGLLAGEGLTFFSALLQIIFHKTWYILLTLVLPILLIDLPAVFISWWISDHAFHLWFNLGINLSVGSHPRGNCFFCT
jgi:linoleoyl-CoA desaturase